MTKKVRPPPLSNLEGTRMVQTDDDGLPLSLALTQRASSKHHGDHFEELAASKVKGALSSILKETAERGEAITPEQRAKGR